MPKSLHKFLLERIAKHAKPHFLGSELIGFPESDLSLWLDAGVLKRADAPRRVKKVCEDGIERELEVFKHGEHFFGRCADPEDPFPAIKLSEVELSRYRLSRMALVKAIALANHFDPIAFDEDDPLPCIGEAEGHAVFLLQPVPPFADLCPKLYLLADQLAGQPGVILAPVTIPIPTGQRKQVAALGLQFMALGSDPARPFRFHVQPDAVAEVDPEAEEYSMRHTGSSWSINCLGAEFTVKNQLGARYVAHLLANPAAVFNATQLKNFLSPSECDRENSSDSTLIAEEAIESSTRDNVVRLKKRERQLEGERERETNETVIAEINQELAEIDAELKRVLTRFGEIRKEGGTLEKDRKSVSNSIRRGIYEEAREACPAFLKYLEKRIDLGSECMFFPAEGENWKVGFSKK